MRSLTSWSWRYPQKRKCLNDTPVVKVITLVVEEEELSALVELFKLKEGLIFVAGILIFVAGI